MTRSRFSLFAGLAGLLAGLTSCGEKNTFVPPPPPEVDVQKPLIEDTTVTQEFPGRTQAFSRVEIRARVKGFLKSREYQPGQFVKKDQLLFTIEPEQFQAAVTSAEGNLAKAKADLEIATTNWQKRRDANQKNQAVSEIDVLSAEADKKAPAAAVDIADAALADANRDLSYTQVISPTDGRVSRDLVDQGNLVGAADPTLLSTVVQDDPVYFNFEVNERTIIPYLNLRPTDDNPNFESPKNTDGNLKLMLADGSEYPVKGKFDYIDNVVDPESGTVKVRAIFENDDGELADSMFARIGIPEVIKEAVLVPRASVQRDLGGSFVLIVGEENKVKRQVVVPSPHKLADNLVIEPYDEATNTGLKADDLVIVSNLQRARAGIVVTPVEMPAAKANPDAAPPPTEPTLEKAAATDPAPAEKTK